MSERISMYNFNYICPVCKSNKLDKTKGTAGDWVREYTCQNCKSVIELNEGDKMGGQFDSITILKNTTTNT